MTNRQKQNLLQYLGYYLAVPDGIWGEKSRAATRAFQQAWGLPASGVFDRQTEAKIRQVIGEGAEPEPPDWWQEVAHFRREEFRCPCGQCGGFPAEPEEKLVRLAERVRTAFDTPVLISSGVRCPAHNAAVGGVKNSRHLLGKAMDFRVKNVSGEKLLAYVRTLPVRYAYRIDGSFVHMDVA